MTIRLIAALVAAVALVASTGAVTVGRRAPDPVSVAAAESPVVQGHATRSVGAGTIAAAYAEESQWALTPAELEKIYGLPAHGGAGQTVAIIGWAPVPHLEEDLAEYRAFFGLPACTTADGCLTIVNQDGNPPDPAPASVASVQAANEFEFTMDAEAVSAACPDCRILMVLTDTMGLTTATNLATASRLGADYAAESMGSVGTAPVTNGHSWAVKIPDGMTFVASSGDEGTARGASYPADSPGVVAAGGTTINAYSGRGKPTAWDGAGAACATTAFGDWPVPETMPANAERAAACGDVRATSDVSAVAGGTTLYVWVDGHLATGGGTSLSAPILAAMYARAGNNVNGYSVYTNAAQYPEEFTDVTKGRVLGCSKPARRVCSATAGWDGPTGVGSPYGDRALAATPTPPAAELEVKAGSALNLIAGKQARRVVRVPDAPAGETLTFGAVGLPAGLAIDEQTGVITGSPSVAAVRTRGGGRSDAAVVSAKTADGDFVGLALLKWHVSGGGRKGADEGKRHAAEDAAMSASVGPRPTR